MSKLEVNAKVNINYAKEGDYHSFRELTDIAYEAEQAENFVANVVKGIAPHYHRLASEIEARVASDKDSADLEKVEVIEKALEVFEGYIDDELTYLRRAHDWDGKNLPAAAYRATRSIIACMKYGGSLLENTTVSLCEKYAKEAKRAATQAAKDADKAKVAAENGDKASNDSEGGVTFPPALGLSDEEAALVAKMVNSVTQAFKDNKGQAKTLVESTTRKADNIVDGAAKSLANSVRKAS